MTFVSDGYRSKGSLLYIIETVQDLFNEDFEAALIVKAAYTLFNIITVLPFIDGNKRTAFGAADMSLRLNGYSIKIDAEDGRKFVVKVATGKIDETEVRKWARQRSKTL